MSNGTKIKTMKDDLLEIENKVSQSLKVPEKQQKSATLSSIPSGASSGQRPSVNFSLPKSAPKSGDLKTKELRNIVDRLSKNKSGIASAPTEKTASSYKPDIKTSTSEATELKALIDRISKREGEREKPLTKSVSEETVKPIETKPVETPAVIFKKPEPVEKPIAKQEPKKTVKPLKTPVTDDTTLEKPDLETLIKPVSKPLPKNEERKIETAPENKLAAETGPEKVPDEQQFAPQMNNRALEEKITETKEVLDSISKKENELKELLEKMTNKKQVSASGPGSETETISQRPGISSTGPNVQFKKASAPTETTYLDKLVKPVEKPSLKSLGIKKTLLTAPEQKTGSDKKNELKEERPIMKKVRERLFGMEKEITQTMKAEEEAAAPAAGIGNENASGPAEREETPRKEEAEAAPLKKTEAKDYFKKIAEEKNSYAPMIESVEEKFSDLPQEKQISGIKPEHVNEIENTTGVLKSISPADAKKEDELAKARRNYLDSQYVSPASRLVFGKQEHYSSIRKHIAERHLDANLKDLESKVAIAKNIVISDKEEKKKLKERIISKYHIKSSPFLRNVLIIAIIAIAIGGIALYGYLSKIETKPPETTIPVITGSELKELSQIKDSLDISATKLKNPTTLRDEAIKKFSSDPNLKLYRLIIKNDNGNIVELKEALTGIGINTAYMPKPFMDSTENEYSFIISKTSKSTARLAIAIKLKSPESMQNTMTSWEKDKVKMKDALNPLFISDRSSDISNSYFQAGNYRGVNMRYVSLPDKDTAIDYFIYKNFLVVATTKDDTFRLIEILTAIK